MIYLISEHLCCALVNINSLLYIKDIKHTTLADSFVIYIINNHELIRGEIKILLLWKLYSKVFPVFSHVNTGNLYRIQNGSLDHFQAKVKRLYIKLDVIKHESSFWQGENGPPGPHGPSGEDGPRVSAYLNHL